MVTLLDGYTLTDSLWELQKRTVKAVVDEIQEGCGRRIVVQSPTGTGKTRVSMELFKWCDYRGSGGNFYINRKLLVPQTLAQMDGAGLYAGVRAAEYEDLFEPSAPFQVTSCQSEEARVYKSGRWGTLHHVGEDGIVIVDEAHIQKSKTMKNILSWYENQGATIVLLSATPVAMQGWGDRLIISGTLKEWRDQGALVMVRPFTIGQLDLAKVTRSAKDGEYVLGEQKKKEFIQHIVGDVIEHYERLHEKGPTMVYCPGVAESKWLTQQFAERGHNFIHVDATSAVIGGKKYQMNRKLWDEEIVPQVKSGDVLGLSSRFKLREGVDIPAISHVILATPIGSLASYLQICGRAMRAYSDGDYVKPYAILQDHGGTYHNQGSCNRDRDWEELWQMKESHCSTRHMDRMREGEVPESIRCPECGAERARGPKCWQCGYEHEKPVRRIMQENGQMIEVEGDIVPRVRRIKRHDTEQLWRQMYYGFRNKQVNRTFAQMEAFFCKQHGYRPPRDIPFMPRRGTDMKSVVHEVPIERLIGSYKEKIT